MTNPTVTITPNVKRKRLIADIQRDIYMYLMLVPGVLTLILFAYIPMGGIVIAFQRYNIFKGFLGSEWVGLKNFESVFSSPIFLNVLKNTLIISIYKLIALFPFTIFVSLLLNEIRNRLFKRSIQTLLYIPFFISWVVISGIMLSILSPTYGIAGDIYRALGMTPVNLMASAKHFRMLVVVSEVWKSLGSGTILYLAAISTIDPNLYEAAFMDGANRWKMMWHITLPSLNRVIVLNLILSIGFIMSAGFDQIIVMRNPMVLDVGEIFDTYVYQIGLVNRSYSFSTALGLFKGVVTIILIFSANLFAKKIGEEGIL